MTSTSTTSSTVVVFRPIIEPAPALDPVFTGLVSTELVSIARERSWVGTHCPVCRRHMKVDQRTITMPMAKALNGLYRTGGTTRFVPWEEIVKKRSDEAKLRYWGLVEQHPDDDGWRVTEAGRAFLHGEITVPKYVNVYDKRQLGPPFGPRWSIRDALGKHFDLEEIRAPALRAVEDGPPIPTPAETAPRRPAFASAYTATAEQLAEARGWLGDCLWTNADTEQIAEVTDTAVIVNVERTYDGGWAAFCAALDAPAMREAA
jgi:hypothetical protein